MCEGYTLPADQAYTEIQVFWSPHHAAPLGRGRRQDPVLTEEGYLLPGDLMGHAGVLLCLPTTPPSS